MGPKSKGGKATPKEEWCLCPSSGLLYHQVAKKSMYIEEHNTPGPTHSG